MKTIAIYGVQVLMGAIVLAASYAKLSGFEIMVQQFAVLGLGQGFLFIAGSVEIIAGLCLLLPRGGVVGAVLLVCVTVGALGMTIGHLASAGAAPAPPISVTFQSIAKSGDGFIAKPVVSRSRTEWDI
jgi:uncharacterized membrane protein YphA (DoxX/SURF4 family)